MPSLCCFQFKKTDPAPSSKRSRLTHQPQRPIPSSLHAPPPVPVTGTPQPLSQSQARTSTQRPQRRTPETPWPDSRPLIDRTVTLQKPLVSSPAIPHSPSRDTGHCYPSSRKLARGSIHIHTAPAPQPYHGKTDIYAPAGSPLNNSTGMARSRPRNDSPQCREETLALLEGRAPNTLSFNQRMSQLSTSAPTEIAPQQQTFLDDDTSDSEIDLFHEDSGYSSALLSPVKKQHRTTNSTTNQPFLTLPRISSPATPTSISLRSSISSKVQHTPETRSAPALCDHRHCLRHKQSCLEHPPTPPSTRQSTYRRRKIHGEMSRRADADVWVRVGTEYAAGSCGRALSRTV
jgi:hypothetical protein